MNRMDSYEYNLQEGKASEEELENKEKNWQLYAKQ